MPEEVKKNKLRRRKWKMIIYIAAGILFISLITRPVLNKIVETNVKEKLKQLAPLAVVRFSSLHADIFSSRISINDLLIKYQPNTLDSVHYHLINFSKADLTGINFIDVILHKNLLINNLKLGKGAIELDQNLLNKKDSVQYDLSSHMPFKNVSINHFETSETSVYTQVNHEKISQLEGSIHIDGLKIVNSHTFSFNAVQCNATNIDSHIPSSQQTLQIKHLFLNSRQKVLAIDSAHIFNVESMLKHLKNLEMFTSGLIQMLNEAGIDSLIITNSTCNLEEPLSKGNQFRIRKIEIAGLNKSSDSNLHYLSFKCSIYNINYSIPHVYRRLYIGSLDADSKKKLLKIADVKITTQYSKFEYGKKLGRQADYIEATIPLAEISDIDFAQLPQKKLVAGKIMIDGGKFYFFRDRRLPRQLKQQPMPNDYLKEIPIEVRANTFSIKNAYAVSEEFPRVGNQSGYLAIGKVNISMSPMLNHPTKNDPGYSNTYVEGSIMNAGLIKATIHAPLQKNIYFITGNIKNLDLSKLNPSAENLGKFHIESGILNSLDFHFTATEEKAKGEIVGEYHDLLIDRLKVKKGEKKVAQIPTFFLKHLIIPKNKDKSLNVKKRTGKIEYDRDPTRMVTFYFLKSLLNGIRASFTFGFLLPE